MKETKIENKDIKAPAVKTTLEVKKKKKMAVKKIKDSGITLTYNEINGTVKPVYNGHFWDH